MSTKGPTSPFTGIARKRDLWWQFTVRAIEVRYRGSYLGILWAVLNPLLMLGIYFAVFGVIFTSHYGRLSDETPTDYAMAMFLGLTLYQLIAETLGASPVLIVGNTNLVKKVVFPSRYFRSPSRAHSGSISQLASSWHSEARLFSDAA